MAIVNLDSMEKAMDKLRCFSVVAGAKRRCHCMSLYSGAWPKAKIPINGTESSKVPKSHSSTTACTLYVETTSEVAWTFFLFGLADLNPPTCTRVCNCSPS